jgi:CRP-like cAMP-binding protein
MSASATPRPAAFVRGGRTVSLRNVLRRLPKGGPELQAIEAGEIDAVIDYSSSNVILFPAALRALRELANRASAANRQRPANSLLAALPHSEYRRLLAGLEAVTVKFGETLHEPGVPVPYVYFPIDCVVCLMTTVEDRQALGVGLVGHEGVVGISLVFGVNDSPVRALVEAAGTALRMEAAHFHKAFRQCPSLQRELYRYAYGKLALARQTVACNCFHTAEARLARWLLMTSDRVKSSEFFLTQEFLADMLGLRRVTVTEIAGGLKHRNLISYRRGKIRILDRKGLEAVSCRCYTRIEDRQEGA